ncbi:hypothetical protein NK6_5321 [Bradyrhizobium diazoefficiens]|uniref:Uncharacterized protein n=1 Tax=Bradyrhizobium diazoefficiens TaxID=1355477 RepID=A0A0E3VV37_9BRAD|nr:hypothetical protein NK6_5321 [Bradyrhizobium diazoefficiens]
MGWSASRLPGISLASLQTVADAESQHDLPI